MRLTFLQILSDGTFACLSFCIYLLLVGGSISASRLRWSQGVLWYTEKIISGHRQGLAWRVRCSNFPHNLPVPDSSNTRLCFVNSRCHSFRINTSKRKRTIDTNATLVSRPNARKALFSILVRGDENRENSLPFTDIYRAIESIFKLSFKIFIGLHFLLISSGPFFICKRLIAE